TGVVGVAVRERQPVATPDVLADARITLTPGLRTAIEQAGYRSVLSVPLFVEDRVIGALSVGDRLGREFADDEVRIMRTFAAQAALALENARLFEETERRRREIELTAELAHAIGATLDLDTVLQRITDGAKDLLGSDVASIGLREPDTGALRARYRVGARIPADPVGEIRPGQGLGGRILASGRPVRTDNYAEDPALSRDFAAQIAREGIVTGLGVPILIDGRVEGALVVWNRAARPFTDRDEALLARLADEAAIAITNAQLFARERQSEQRYRRLFEGASDPIATFALDGAVTSANPETERVLGYAHDEMLGRHFRDFLRPASAALMEDRARRALAGEKIPPTVEVVVIRKDGGELTVEGRVSPMRDQQGQITGWQVIYRDLTERRRAEAALRASEERYRSLVEGSLQGIIIHRDFVTLFANSAFARMFGYESPREVVGVDTRGWIAPEELPRMAAYVAARRGGDTAPSHYEFQALRRDGTRIWAEAMVSTVAWDGQPATQVAVFDVTERKRAEEALRQSEDVLRQSQKMEAVGRLAGGIAHDFNNLLTVITGRTELLLLRLPADDRRRRDLELVKKTAERAASLIQQLLAFSRKQMLQPRRLDLNEVVAGMAQMLERLIGENLELLTTLEPALGAVRADPAQVEQIVLNLAVNARDAMPQGGRLAITTANVDLDAAFVDAHPGASPGPHAVLAVTDTGVGMSAEVLAHVFEPFFTTKEVGKGTGLGLATVYGIVKQHNGYVEVQSAPGRGTRVRIYLPQVGEPVEGAGAPGGRRAGPASTTGTILLVEDQHEVRELAREILDAAGYTVLAAGDPQQALELARRHDGAIDLLLTDVVMPLMSGRELADRLTPGHPGMRVLYMSGYTDDAIVRHGALDADTVLLPKPFTPDSLARQVQEMLRR
ncbi:MAG: PAS domain S-box protein, partial [Candidatus Rokubacteria bacterium]|nr:PAS domain S-box protein [Candidatus Rokubacteria bacterium]